MAMRVVVKSGSDDDAVTYAKNLKACPLGKASEKTDSIVLSIGKTRQAPKLMLKQVRPSSLVSSPNSNS